IEFHITCATCMLNDTITGASAGVCVSGTETLTHSIPGGTWSSSNPSVATIGSSSGIISGVAIGTTTITYNVSGHITTSVISVVSTPDAGSISGTPTTCLGTETFLFDAVPGGIWSSSAPFVTDVFEGEVFGESLGTSTVSYTVTNACGSASATVVVTV